ncbi:MAG TPA: lipocalin-like domain-containing protein [Bryobacteraceae bacterium]|nr:lipocalin-like domain-containing protein [Bryobacteraceae bacterium]
MKTSFLFLLAFRLAVPGYHYQFPRDHFNHPEFQTEWWYYTGNVHTAGGREFGFELTFFRRALKPEPASGGVWDARDLWLAHLALSDIDGRHFYHTERLNRAGPGLAGADAAQARVWNGNWETRWGPDSSTQQLRAVAEHFAVDLALDNRKRPAIHGLNGVSQKAAEPGRASHYISLTRLAAHGTVTVEGQPFLVDGLAWMDHEFFTQQLDTRESGWDWLSLQLAEGSELMLFRLRHKDGTTDPYSAGTYIDAQGRTKHLAAGDFAMLPGSDIWTSPATHGVYPISWTVRVPSVGIDAAVSTRLPQQELAGSAITPPYWEGAIKAIGTRGASPLSASGYLEMTGYAGPAPLSE